MAKNSITSWKQQKEDFVSNLSGGTVLEIVQVTAVAPVAMLLWSILQSRQSFFKPYTALAFMVDFLINVGAFLLAVTLFASTPLLLSGFLVAAAIVVYALPPISTTRKKQIKIPPTTQIETRTTLLDVTSAKPFMTTYRGFLMIMTVTSILAVDFRLFPRRFAKVETWGTSLMDLGVGSFVFSAGIVAAKSVLKKQALGRSAPLWQRLRRALRHLLPLLVLGVVRLVSVKGLDYAEHVSEYGVHWNFFFTLAFLSPFVALFQSALKIMSCAGLAILLGVLYQVVLESTSLKAYILTAPRTDLLSMNREGIFSFIGYLAIFLAGQHTGMLILPTTLKTLNNSSASTQRITLVLTLGMWTLVWTALFFLVSDYKYGAGLSVSRRLANLAYVFWVAALNTAQVFLFCAIDAVCFPAFYNPHDGKTKQEAYKTATSRILHAYNRNGLVLFLVANLFTGLVNLTFPTLNMGQMETIGVLLAYLVTLTGLAVGLDVYNVTIKL